MAAACKWVLLLSLFLKSFLSALVGTQVRDVLQMVQGQPSKSFSWEESTQIFSLKNGLHLSHLSPSSLTALLSRFMNAASSLRRIDSFVKRVARASLTTGPLHMQASPTLQAFASTVSLKLEVMLFMFYFFCPSFLSTFLILEIVELYSISARGLWRRSCWLLVVVLELLSLCWAFYQVYHGKLGLIAMLVFDAENCTSLSYFHIESNSSLFGHICAQ